MAARDGVHVLARLRRLGDQPRLVLVAVAAALVAGDDLDATRRTGAVARDSLKQRPCSRERV